MASPVTITTSSGANGTVAPPNATWSTVRGAAAGSGLESFFIERFEGGNYRIARHFFFFDLSTTNIPADATITAITFVHPVVSSVTNDNSISIHLAAHTSADPVSTASYNDLTLNGATSWAEKNVADLSTGGSTNIVMNAAGITAANTALGGTWKVMIRGDGDLDNSAPAGKNQYNFTDDDVQISVTYTQPGSPSSGFFALL